MKSLYEISVGILAVIFMLAWSILPYVVAAWIVLAVAGVV